MPRRPPAIPADAAQLRRLEATLAELSVPALLRIREAADDALAREHLRAADIEPVLRAAEAP